MKKEKLPKIILILILTLLTSIVWVSLNVYRSFTVKPSPSVPEEISKPLTPSLDQNTMKKVESRIFFEDSQIPDLISSQTQVTPTPSPIPESTPASQSATTPVPTPTSTPTPTGTP